MYPYLRQKKRHRDRFWPILRPRQRRTSYHPCWFWTQRVRKEHALVVYYFRHKGREKDIQLLAAICLRDVVETLKMVMSEKERRRSRRGDIYANSRGRDKHQPPLLLFWWQKETSGHRILPCGIWIDSWEKALAARRCSCREQRKRETSAPGLAILVTERNRRT